MLVKNEITKLAITVTGIVIDFHISAFGPSITYPITCHKKGINTEERKTANKLTYMLRRIILLTNRTIEMLPRINISNAVIPSMSVFLNVDRRFQIDMAYSGTNKQLSSRKPPRKARIFVVSEFSN